MKVPDTQSMWTSELLAALNASPIGTFIVQEQQFKFTSKQFQRYLGYSEEEMLGADSMSFVFPEDRDMVRENAIQMLKGLRSDYLV